MKCFKCKEKAVIEMPYAAKAYCGEHFIEVFEKRFKRTIKMNNLFNKKDKIAVGVSGGKDSMVMLYLLKDLGYNVEAIIIDEGIRGYRDRSMPLVKTFCTENKIKLHVYSFEKEFKTTLDKIVKKGALPCSYCGVLRRRLLNKAARDIKADVLAIGHNLDDETQMILMNFFRSELVRLSRSGPTVGLVNDSKFVHRVKPLRESPERENVAYALVRGVPYEDIECPYSKTAYRDSVRDALNDLESKHPGVKIGCLHSFDKLLPFLRDYYKKEKSKPNKCKECGELTSGEICKACEMLKRLL